MLFSSILGLLSVGMIKFGPYIIKSVGGKSENSSTLILLVLFLGVAALQVSIVLFSGCLIFKTFCALKDRYERKKLERRDCKARPI